jgi:hypothetical protein
LKQEFGEHIAHKVTRLENIKDKKAKKANMSIVMSDQNGSVPSTSDIAAFIKS